MTNHVTYDQAELRQFRYKGLAVRLYGEAHVYVLAFDSGLIKVGRTTKPQQRINAHLDNAQVHRATPLAVWLSVPHANAKANEDALISYCAGIATLKTRSEYFVGVELADLVAYAESLSYRRLDAPAPKVQKPSPTAQSDAEWGEKIRTGQVVALTTQEFEELSRKVELAEEIHVSLKRVLGTKELTLTKLPQRLRHAADVIELFPRVRGDWMRLLPDMDENERPLPTHIQGEEAAGQTPVGGVAPTTAPVVRGWAADPTPLTPGSAAPESP
jgi:hypothetical protein